MKSISLFIFIFFFSFVALSAENDEAQTEAGAGCMTPECLGVDGALGSRNSDIAELCRATLPAHCQKIKDIKLTTCYDGVYGGFANKAAAPIYCFPGIWEGVKEVGTGLWNLGKGTWNFAVDEEYRDEALNTMSFFFEQFSDPEEIKSLLADPILESIDKFFQCLNLRGKWEYGCGKGIQLVGGWHTGKKFIYNPIRKKFRRKLNPEELRAQIATLENRLDVQTEAIRRFNRDQEAGKEVMMSQFYQHQANKAAIRMRLSELRIELMDQTK